MSNITPEEAQAIRDDLTKHHKLKALELVSMWNYFDLMVREFADYIPVSSRAQQEMLWRLTIYMHAEAERHGISIDELKATSIHMSKAAKTVSALSAHPNGTAAELASISITDWLDKAAGK